MLIEGLETQCRLTRREAQVLEFTAQGLTSKEIAQELSIAPRTVERHIENARLRLGARNRVHLISKAVGAGLWQAHH